MALWKTIGIITLMNVMWFLSKTLIIIIVIIIIKARTYPRQVFLLWRGSILFEEKEEGKPRPLESR